MQVTEMVEFVRRVANTKVPRGFEASQVESWQCQAMGLLDPSPVARDCHSCRHAGKFVHALGRPACGKLDAFGANLCRRHRHSDWMARP